MSKGIFCNGVGTDKIIEHLIINLCESTSIVLNKVQTKKNTIQYKEYNS